MTSNKIKMTCHIIGQCIHHQHQQLTLLQLRCAICQNLRTNKIRVSNRVIQALCICPSPISKLTFLTTAQAKKKLLWCSVFSIASPLQLRSLRQCQCLMCLLMTSWRPSFHHLFLLFSCCAVRRVRNADVVILSALSGLKLLIETASKDCQTIGVSE